MKPTCFYIYFHRRSINLETPFVDRFGYIGSAFETISTMRTYEKRALLLAVRSESVVGQDGARTHPFLSVHTDLIRALYRNCPPRESNGLAPGATTDSRGEAACVELPGRTRPCWEAAANWAPWALPRASGSFPGLPRSSWELLEGAP